MKKSKLKRMDENRLYPSTIERLMTSLPTEATERYVKNYFQINRNPPFSNPPIKFKPCTYIIGEKEFIA